jgi:hypothetical protein
VQRVLQVASDMQKRRKEFASPLHGVCSEWMNKSALLENGISNKNQTCWSTVANAERWAADI